MTGSPGKPGPESPLEPRPLPRRLYLVLALAPVLLAAMALAGLMLFHCARI